jgi:hypothetical protein
MSNPDSSARPPYATDLVAPRDLHMEIIDPATRAVWQSIEPISMAAYKAFTVEPPFLKVGIGASVMDEHWFERSPGAAPDGAMEVREIGGRRFAFCAVAPADGGRLPAGPDGPRLLMVEKHHVLLYRAGRSVPILRTPDGDDFVHVVHGGLVSTPLQLPAGWQLRSVELQRDWIVPLPSPTAALFFANRDGFQGPLTALPDEMGAR